MDSMRCAMGRVFRDPVHLKRPLTRVALPDFIEEDIAKASYDHGLLTPRMPKAVEAKPWQVKISVKSKPEGR